MSSRPRGFSLIELMVSATLGMFALAAVGKVFQATSRSYSGNEQVSRTHDNLRFAMAQIVSDIEMAGFFAQVADPDQDITIAEQARNAYAGSACTASWLFDDLAPIDTIGNATGAQVSSRYPCVRGAHDGSDVLAIKRVLGACEPAPAHNRFYLGTNGYQSAFRFGAAGLPDGTPCAATSGGPVLRLYQYHPVIWHVATDQGVPALCRMALSGARLARDCVAQGIEDLQLEFGLNAPHLPGQADGVADQFTSFDTPPDGGQRHRIVAVRIHLLGRSTGTVPDRPQVHAERSFRMGNVERRTGADGYYRKSLSALVPVRNLAQRANPVRLP